jgi:non-ribosomal peptide synthetase component F
VFDILLFKYTGQQDILIGTPIAGRNHADLENILGFFVNTLVMRNILKKEQLFRDFLEGVKINTIEAFKNQDYPFEELVNKLNIKKSLDRNPLFDVFFVGENMNAPALKIKYLDFIPYPIENKISHFDLVFYFLEIEDTISLKLEYSTRLFKLSTAKEILNHYIEILNQVVNNQDIQLKEIEISYDLLVPKVKIQEMEFEF